MKQDKIIYNTPPEIAEEFSKSAIKKASFSTLKLLVYSVLGGAFIALGGLLAIVVSGGMPGVAATNPGITKFVFGALFPLGLVLVIVGGAELFTSDCAVITYGVLNRQLSVSRLLKTWLVVYAGNFIGAVIVAYLFAYQTQILSTDPWLSAAKHIGEHKVSGDFLATFIKGVGANWLVCMAVWLAYAAKDVTGKILGVWFPVMCFVTFGFEHSIANMFFIPTSMLLGAHISFSQFLIGNLLPATLGNILGGALLVALPYWFMFSHSPNKVSNEHPGEPGSFNYRSIKIIDKHLN